LLWKKLFTSAGIYDTRAPDVFTCATLNVTRVFPYLLALHGDLPAKSNIFPFMVGYLEESEKKNLSVL